jgi:hypothetical protein
MSAVGLLRFYIGIAEAIFWCNRGRVGYQLSAFSCKEIWVSFYFWALSWLRSLLPWPFSRLRILPSRATLPLPD